MAGTVTCPTCGQANATESEYCVRCGERMPDPSTTQVVGTGGVTEPQAYPWEPPAEWDPGELPPAGQPAPTWVAQNPAAQQGTQGGGPSWGGTGGGGGGWSQPSTGGGFAPPPQKKSKKPLFLAGGAVVVIAAVVAVVLVLTTGGKKSVALNGLEKKNATDVLADSRIAFRDAKSVHLAGNVTSDGQQIKLDLLLTGSDSKGTLTISGNDVQLIRIGDDVYIKGDPDFLKQIAGSKGAEVADQLNGKWLKAGSAQKDSFDAFSIDGFANLLKADSSTNATVRQSELNGAKVVVVTQKDGSALSIANTGPAYPLLLDSKGDDGGNVTFSDYNAAVSVTAPSSSDVLDLDAITPSTSSTPSPTYSPSSPSYSPSSPTPTPSDSTAALAGSYTCKDPTGSKNGGTLTLIASGHKYTLSGGAAGGFWGTSGHSIAFSGGVLDQFLGRFTDSGTIVMTIKGEGTNANVSYTCTAQ
jgi:hypothetical protein